MSQILLAGAQLSAKRSFMSGKGKMCYVVEVTFFGGTASAFIEPEQFAKCQAVEGQYYDVVADLKFAGGKFELSGCPEFHPEDSCSLVTPKSRPVAGAPDAVPVRKGA